MIAAALIVSGFFCFAEAPVERMLAANARGASVGDYSEENELAANLIAAGQCVRVADENRFDAFEVYRGKIVPVAGGADKQVIGLAQAEGQPPQLFGIDVAEGRGAGSGA